jgi:hypothetical protein
MLKSQKRVSITNQINSMKYLISFLFSGFLLLGIGQVKEGKLYEGTAGEPGITYIVRYGIEFGTPRKDCKGFGFCLVYEVELKTLTGKGPGGVNSAIGDAFFDENGRFTVNFPRQGMQDETRWVYFDGSFRMEDPFVIPSEMLDRLGHPGTYTIKAGTYPVIEQGDNLVVRF